MSGYQLNLGALGLAGLTALVSLAGAPAPAQSQSACTGFAVGCAVHWQMPPPKGASTWRAGAYTGTIVEVLGGFAVPQGTPPETGLVDLQTGKMLRVRMDQLRAIRCYPPEQRRVPTYSSAVPVCQFEGAVNGPMGVYYTSSLRIRLSQEIVLSDGNTATLYAGGFDSFENLALGVGTNDWPAKKGDDNSAGGTKPGTTGTTQGTGNTGTTQGTGNTGGSSTGGNNTGGGSTGGEGRANPPRPPIPHGRTVPVPEIGQGYAQALKVEYPAVIQAQMGVQDYDTVLFNFAGGPFHAHTNSKLNLVADLLDAQGNMITRAVGGNLSFDQNLPAGTYGIIVRVMNYAGTGAYELVLGTGAGKTYQERE